MGAHLEFRLAPGGEAVNFLPVKSVFYVVLKGHAETAARQLLIWNLHKNWSSTLVGPQRVGDELVWGPIQLKRDCDPVREGMAAVIVADAGDMLVAAVDLTGAVAPTPKGTGEMPPGPSATARVVLPKAMSRVLKLLDPEGKEVVELGCGTYTVHLEAPDLDVTCATEEVTLNLVGGGKSVELTLVETAPASGIFEAPVGVECRCAGCALETTVAGLPVSLGAKVGFVAEGVQLVLPVARLEPELELPAQVDVGQEFTVEIKGVEEPDELRICVDGNPVHGPTVSLAEAGPHAISAFVRRGSNWGTAAATVMALDRTEIVPMGFDPTEAPAETVLQLALRNATDDPDPVVYVGKIGKGCPEKIGVSKSHTFTVDPTALGAGPGDVIWIYYEDPDFPADHTYLLVYLR